MDDLISRQAAIDEIRQMSPELFSASYYHNAYVDKQEVMIRLITLPSAEPERKKGKWIKENIVLTSNPPQYRWHCSECEKMVNGFTTEVLTNYCPNCGARMENE